MKILMIGMPAHGHLNPTLFVAKELVKRGHRVTYLINQEFSHLVGETGVQVECYADPCFDRHNPGTFLGYNRPAYELGLRLGKDHDCILYSMVFFYGERLGRALAKPTIRMQPNFAMTKKLIHEQARRSPLTALLTNKFLRPHVFNLMLGKAADPELTHYFDPEPAGMELTFITKQFQPDEAELDPARWKFVGPIIEPSPDFQDKVPAEMDLITRPVIYVSLGTIFRENSRFYRTCVNAFKSVDATVVLSIGETVDPASLGSLPEHIHLIKHVSLDTFLAILSRASVFVTHCGINSTNSAFYFGVPMVAVPQESDQFIVAEKVAELGCGRFLKKVTPERLRQAVLEVMQTPSYKCNTLIQQAAVRKSGGVIQAADEIEFFLQRVYNAAPCNPVVQAEELCPEEKVVI